MINLIYLKWMKAPGGVVAHFFECPCILANNTEKTGLVTERYWIQVLVWWNTALSFFFYFKFPSTLWHIQYWLSQFRLFVSTCMVWCSCLPYFPPSGVKHLLFSSLTPRKMIDHVSFMAKLIILTFLTLLWKNNQTKRSLRSLTEEIVPVWRSFKSWADDTWLVRASAGITTTEMKLP